MADYCGMCDGAVPSADAARREILGDFLEPFERVEPRLVPFLMSDLGICEGHGTSVKVSMDMHGRLWFEHVLLDPTIFQMTEEELLTVPGPVEIPPGTLTPEQSAFITRLHDCGALTVR